MSEFKSTCAVSEYSYHLSGLRTDKLYRHCQKYFYSVDVMEAARCICNAITTSTHLSSKDRFREYIKSEISNLSNSEYSSSLVKHSSDGVFIIKSCSDGSCDLLKEADLCFRYLNRLRQITPVFRYMFDYIDCSPILTNSSKVAICPMNGPGYCMMEIVEGISFRNFIEICTFEEFMKVYIMMILSFRLTKDIELTLYNCTEENIMVRMLDEEMMFIFNIDGKPINISSACIPTIMNYEKARYIRTNEYGEVEICATEYIEYVELEDAVSLIKSAYKLIGTYNRSLIEKINLLLEWFMSSEEKNLDRLIKFCFSLAGKMSKGVLPFYKNKMSEELTALGMTSYGKKLSFIEYYDLKDHSPDIARNNFNIDEAFSKEVELIESLKEELRFKIEIENLKQSRLSSHNYFILFKRRAICFMIYLNSYHRLKLHYKIGTEILQEYSKDSSYYREIEAIIEDHREWITQMKVKVLEIQNIINFLNDIFDWYSYGINMLKLAIENEEI